jgi:hypothetical protein
MRRVPREQAPVGAEWPGPSPPQTRRGPRRRFPSGRCYRSATHPRHRSAEVPKETALRLRRIRSVLGLALVTGNRSAAGLGLVLVTGSRSVMVTVTVTATRYRSELATATATALCTSGL